MLPDKIEIKDKTKLYIAWPDNSESVIRLVNLRRACPCAVCNAEREEQGPDYIPIYNDDQIAVKDIKLMGYYGIKIRWKDGHDTGIYEFSHLQKLTQK